MAAYPSSITPRLSPGILSIYGVPSIYGFTDHSGGITFGVIHDMSAVNSGWYSVGQNVLMSYTGADSVTYQGQMYWLVDESKIILVEQQVII